jgi:hypothetical protein
LIYQDSALSLLCVPFQEFTVIVWDYLHSLSFRFDPPLVSFSQIFTKSQNNLESQNILTLFSKFTQKPLNSFPFSDEFFDPFSPSSIGFLAH